MLDQTFGRVYTKFKLHFYKQIFSRFEDREATLTTCLLYTSQSPRDRG